jgi:spore germination protein KC
MFLRFHETRLEVWVIISDCPATELLQVTMLQELVPASALSLMMHDRSEISPHLAANVLNVTSALLDAPTALVAPLVGVEEEFGKNKAVIQGSAVFNSDKLSGYLNEDETMGYALAKDDAKSELLQVTAEGGSAVLYVSNSSASLKPRIKDGLVQADITIDATLSVGEITGFEGEKLPAVFEKLETAGKQRILELATMAFQKSVALNADIFGIGSALNRSDPKAWKGIKDNWQVLYPSTGISISVSGELTETGKIADSLSMQGEK